MELARPMNFIGKGATCAIHPARHSVVNPSLPDETIIYNTMEITMSKMTVIYCSNLRTATLAAVLLTATLAAGDALAGPPFLTDDPIPVEQGHWEFYGFTQATRTSDGTDGVLPAIEANYGILPHAMVHVVVPVRAYTDPKGAPSHHGLGDMELGIKYQFVEEDPNGSRPAIGVFPIVVTPTGDNDKGLGGGETQVFLPIWLQKSFGPWTTYGGGGWWHNPGTGNKDYWFVGWLLQRQVTDNLTLGGEVFHQTKDTVGGMDTTGFNVGGFYDFNDNHHLLFSVGKGLTHVDTTNQRSYYLGYQFTF